VIAAHVNVQITGGNTVIEMINMMNMYCHQCSKMPLIHTNAVNDGTTATMTTREKDTFLCKPKNRCLPVIVLYSA
jgi:hypothetical protein